MLSFGLILLIILGAILLFLWTAYNGLVTTLMRVKEAFSGIDVQLKRRSSLIPNLVETVKGYAAHEKEVFENVTAARSALVNATTPGQKSQADNQLTGALKTLFAVAENYPELKANENFAQLQSELSDTEDKLAYARQFYNTSVLDYNTKLKTFPTVAIAGFMSFKPEEFFQAESEARQDVKVSFGNEA